MELPPLDHVGWDLMLEAVLASGPPSRQEQPDSTATPTDAKPPIHLEAQAPANA